MLEGTYTQVPTVQRRLTCSVGPVQCWPRNTGVTHAACWSSVRKHSALYLPRIVLFVLLDSVHVHTPRARDFQRCWISPTPEQLVTSLLFLCELPYLSSQNDTFLGGPSYRSLLHAAPVCFCLVFFCFCWFCYFLCFNQFWRE